MYDLLDATFEWSRTEALVGVPEIGMNVGGDDDLGPESPCVPSFDGEATWVAVKQLQKEAVGNLLTSVEVVKDEFILAVVTVEPAVRAVAEVEAESVAKFVVCAARFAETGRSIVDLDGEVSP